MTGKWPKNDIVSMKMKPMSAIIPQYIGEIHIFIHGRVYLFLCSLEHLAFCGTITQTQSLCGCLSTRGRFVAFVPSAWKLFATTIHPHHRVNYRPYWHQRLPLLLCLQNPTLLAWKCDAIKVSSPILVLPGLIYSMPIGNVQGCQQHIFCKTSHN